MTNRSELREGYYWIKLAGEEWEIGWFVEPQQANNSGDWRVVGCEHYVTDSVACIGQRIVTPEMTGSSPDMTNRSDMSREQLLALVEEFAAQQLPIPETNMLHLRDGDVVVMKYPGHLSQEQVEILKRNYTEHVLSWLKQRSIDVKFLVLSDGADISVIRPET